MFFTAAKIFLVLADPANLLVLLFCAGAAASFLGRTGAGMRLCMTGVVAGLVLGVFPLGSWLLHPLEDRFGRPALPARVDGILVLGGGFHPRIWQTRGLPAEEPSVSRLIAAVELSRRHPEARIVFSGGSGALVRPGVSEAFVARTIFAQLGVDPRRLVFEDRSRNTAENITLSQKLLRPAPGSIWVLATSASAIPRAMGVARRQGWRMIPWPTDYLTPRHVTPLPDIDLSGNLRLLQMAEEEWIGLLAYRLTGRTGTLFPAPDGA